ncbi:hypothetical protein AKJ37_04105 [candidate division MSBL1 archaeon SCGC-AAA259I09]|uniref:Uncharacterized protein n=1 Tax=candidate division MSBL1 archaeon SCGC-AAA259I09 TaxID=1698267 RepID=A0A133URR0_9EURY|nr:hypothetical protein AKJ37_04105 [candidate division MSBL1 archaeon SCGC-AAA259I09]
MPRFHPFPVNIKSNQYIYIYIYIHRAGRGGGRRKRRKEGEETRAVPGTDGVLNVKPKSRPWRESPYLSTNLQDHRANPNRGG